MIWSGERSRGCLDLVIHIAHGVLRTSTEYNIVIYNFVLLDVDLCRKVVQLSYVTPTYDSVHMMCMHYKCQGILFSINILS